MITIKTIIFIICILTTIIMPITVYFKNKKASKFNFFKNRERCNAAWAIIFCIWAISIVLMILL